MKVQSIQLISNNLCYGPAPAPDEEIEQHLTISKTGRVWFSALDFDHYYEGKEYCRRKQIGMSRKKAGFVLARIDQLEEEPMVTDCGTYQLEIRYEDGTRRAIIGSLIGEPGSGDAEVPTPLTKMIRRMVPIDSLFVFDGSMEEDYAGYEAICSFAEMWKDKFLAGKLSEREFEDGFGKDCEALRFQRDAGDWVSDCYPGFMVIPGGALSEAIGKIDDVDLLGAAVYSQWRYLTYWAGRYELNFETCSWFAAALGRMQELAAGKTL